LQTKNKTVKPISR